MWWEIIFGILVPFLGTSIGAATALIMRKNITENITCVLSGIAAGVMTAASVWSLIIPSIEMSCSLGRLSFLPATVGFCGGIVLLMYLDKIISKIFIADKSKKTTMLFIAVTLHNIPEGMAIGAAYSAFIANNEIQSFMSALVLCLGIAIQNIPEGAIVSLPFESEGISKIKAFNYGILSGAVEPASALLTIALARFAVPILPYMLSFAAGAMIYVVIKELIAEFLSAGKENTGILSFTLGFCIMMCLDVALS